MKSTIKILVFFSLLYFTLQAGFQCNVENCQFCSYPNQCGQCNTNFLLTQNTSSGAFYCSPVTCTSNCSYCYQNNICQSCVNGYYINSTGGCSSGSTPNTTLPPNCLYGLGLGSENCTICQYGFTLQLGFCYQTILLTYDDQNCLVKMSSTICQICQTNYIVSPIGKCVQNTLNQTSCNILNCAYCTAANSTCGFCFPGYQLTQSNTCTQNICNMNGCMACAGSGECSACMIGYVLNTTSKTCSQVGYGCGIAACQVCTSPQSCGQCQVGYKLVLYQIGNNTVNLCKKIICPYNVTNCNNCAFIYDSIFNFNKVLCAPGQCQLSYIYVNGYCVPNLGLQITCQNVTNCIQCSYNNFCSQCSSGYVLSRHGTCVPTICNIQNCQSCSLNNICQACNLGYTLSIGNLPLLNPSNNLFNYAYYLLTQQCIPTSISCSVNNCAYCTANGTCIQCTQGYDFTSNNSNICNATCNVANCYQCAQSGNLGTCQFCQPGYTLQNNGQQCQLVSFSCGSGCGNTTAGGNCQYNWITKVGQCISCQPGYTLYNGQCYSATCNIYGCNLCASWTSSVVCMQCQQGLMLSDGYCVKTPCNNNVSNCVNCIGNGPCVGCAQGFYLQNTTGNSTCVAAPQSQSCSVSNCISCLNGNAAQCSSCAAQYKLINGQCYCNFQNCLDCSTSSLTCNLCPQPLFASLQESTCTPQPSLRLTCNVTDCQMCLTQTQCSICAFGFQLTLDFSCAMNNCTALGLNNCQTCDKWGNSCNICQPGYMINNANGGPCYPINQNYTCNITGCAVCNSINNKVCASCLPTYMFNGNDSLNQCVPYSCNISNCYLCLQNNLCTVCVTGYFLALDLTCQPVYSNLSNCQGQIPYCDMCVINLVNNNNQKYCIQCQDGFQFDSTNSVCIPQSNSISNCKIQTNLGYSMNPYCLICEQGYFVNSFGLCTQYVLATNNTGCSIYNCLYCGYNSSLCSFCFVPWGISSTGVCQTSLFCSANCQLCTNSSQCLTCAPSYTVNSTGVCISCNVANCQTCQQANVCATCAFNYTLASTGFCISCPIDKCTACSANGVCQTCNDTVAGIDYFPSSNGNLCVQCDMSATNMSACMSCVSDNSCGICSSGNQLYSATTGGNQVCILCNFANCLSCNLNGCQTCIVGYEAVNGVCLQCQFPCITCVIGSISLCKTCQTPFYLNTATTNGTCITNSVPNCIVYDSSNTSLCTSCDSSSITYVLNTTTNTCQLSCSANCLSCPGNPNVCTSCMDGYLVTSGTCSQCQVPGCQNCANNSTQCFSCYPGYYLYNSQCKFCLGYCSQCTANTTCTALIQPYQQVLYTNPANNQMTLAICQQNCQICSNINPQVCLQCLNGLYLVNGNCMRCSSSCLTCNALSPNVCLSCYANSFLVNGTCSSCSSNCFTCVGVYDLSKCLSCAQGFYLKNSVCVQGCPLNCLNCASQTQCTQCLSGYTLFSQNNNLICAPCVSTCRTCAQGQPIACLTCGNGFYLSGTTCIQCAINCQQCTPTGCISCITGNFLTSSQTCSPNCQIPCATCSSTNPNKCISCIAGYSQNSLNYICSQVTSCNGACSFCPMGYTLNLGQCIKCTGNQCQNCIANSPSNCTSCIAGFYLNPSNSQCQACSSSCATCLTGNGCLTCVAGYTTIQNVPMNSGGYQCVVCASPCATCINSPNYCTSCIPGFQFQGWKCSQSFYFGFTVTLLTTLPIFNQNYYSFILALSNALGNSDPNSITILTITPGSVIVAGGAGPNGGTGTKQVNQQYNSFGSSLSTNSQIAGMTIGQSSITVVNGSIDYYEADLALILGICIPVGVLLIAGIVLYIYCKKKKSAEVIQQKIKQDTGFTVRESFELSTNYKDQNTVRPFNETTGIN